MQSGTKWVITIWTIYSVCIKRLSSELWKVAELKRVSYTLLESTYVFLWRVHLILMSTALSMQLLCFSKTGQIQPMCFCKHPVVVSFFWNATLQINVIRPPGEKGGFTDCLAVRASDGKLPSIIVFRGDQKTGILSENIMSKLNAPENDVVKSTRTAWWHETFDHDFIKSTF